MHELSFKRRVKDHIFGTKSALFSIFFRRISRVALKKRDDALGLAGGHHHQRNQDSSRSDSLELRRTNPFGIGLFSMGLHINSQVFRFL